MLSAVDLQPALVPPHFTGFCSLIVLLLLLLLLLPLDSVDSAACFVAILSLSHGGLSPEYAIFAPFCFLRVLRAVLLHCGLFRLLIRLRFRTGTALLAWYGIVVLRPSAGRSARSLGRMAFLWPSLRFYAASLSFLRLSCSIRLRWFACPSAYCFSCCALWLPFACTLLN